MDTISTANGYQIKVVQLPSLLGWQIITMHALHAPFTVAVIHQQLLVFVLK